MDSYKVFVGSSIVDLKEERIKICVAAQKINDYMIDHSVDKFVDLDLCEFEDRAIANEGSQYYINERIIRSNLAIFIVKSYLGEFTKAEIVLAKANKDLYTKTKIYLFVHHQLNELTKNEIENLISGCDLTRIEYKEVKELLYLILNSINEEYLEESMEFIENRILLNDRDLGL